MTDKRFTCINESIINIQTDELVNASSEESAKIVVDWLNELAEENEQLKKDAQTILFVLCFCKFADGVSMGETEIKAIKRLQKVIGENVIDLKGMGYE